MAADAGGQQVVSVGGGVVTVDQLHYDSNLYPAL